MATDRTTNSPVFAINQDTNMNTPKIGFPKLNLPMLENNLSRNTPPIQKNWHEGEVPTTREYYSGIRQAKGIDDAVAKGASSAFGYLQSVPNSGYYAPYLYKMTNTQVAENMLGLGIDISGGVTQKDIDYLKQYADYSNVNLNGTLNNSGTDAQRLAYNLYQLEQDEVTTQLAEREMENMQTVVNRLVAKGYSDDYIVNHLDIDDYPTLAKMTEYAHTGVALPLNRAVGYSDDYMYGAIWAARNGGSSGNSINDIANYQDKVGNMYVPDAFAEAARNPSSDNYFPYAFGATIDWIDTESYPASGRYDASWLDDNKWMLSGSEAQANEYRKVKSAYNTTVSAQKELTALQSEALQYIVNGETPEEVYELYTKNDMKKLSEKYPTLVKMERARQNGSYITMTDTVGFALPYWQEWLNEVSVHPEVVELKEQLHDPSETIRGDKKIVVDEEALTAPAAQLKTGKETDIEEEVRKEAEETEETASLETPEAETASSETPETEETVTAAAEPVENVTEPEAWEPYVIEYTEEELASVVPTPNFSASAFVRENDGTNGVSDLISAIDDYRRGHPIIDPNAVAFIEKYPYLFGGVKEYTDVMSGIGTSAATSVTSRVDTRYQKIAQRIGPGQRHTVTIPEIGATAGKVLARMDAAQENGLISQWEYEQFLVDLAVEIDNAKMLGKSMDEYLNTEGNTASALLDSANGKIDAATELMDRQTREKRLTIAENANTMFNAIREGYVVRDTAFEAAGMTVEDVNMWYHLYDEAQATPLNEIDLKTIDPDGRYYSHLVGSLDGVVRDELEYNDVYADLGEHENGGYIQLSAQTIISNYAERRFAEDAKTCKVMGITLSDFYAAQGYASASDEKYQYALTQNRKENIDKYRDAVVQEAITKWNDLYVGFENDIMDTLGWMQQYESDYALEDTVTNKGYVNEFTEEEIGHATEEGYITEEQADTLRTFVQTGVPYTQFLTDNGEVDRDNFVHLMQKMHDYMAVNAAQATEEYMRGEGGVKPYDGATGSGSGNPFYTVAKGVDYGWKQHTLSWVDTYLYLTRTDADGTERRLREYSREDVRNNIINAINELKDPAVRTAMQEEFDTWTGDIYDFPFDFTNVSVQNAAYERQKKLNDLDTQMKNVMTQGEYKAATGLGSAVNSTLYAGEAAAIMVIGTKLGVPHKAAAFVGTLGTIGLSEGASLGNELLDANVSKDKANVAVAANAFAVAGLEYLTDVSLKGFGVGVGRTPTVQAVTMDMMSDMSNGAVRTLAHKGMGALSDAATKAAAKVLPAAADLVLEGAGEVGETVARNVTANMVYASEGQWDKIENMTWEEAGEIFGDSLVSGVMQMGISELSNAPKRMSERRAAHIDTVREATKLETLNAETAKALNDALEALNNDPEGIKIMAETSLQMEVDTRTVEKAMEHLDEIENLPEVQEETKAREEMESAIEEQNEAVQEAENAQAVFEQANAEMQDQTIPTQEAIRKAREALNALKEASSLRESSAKLVESLREKFEARVQAANDAKRAFMDILHKEAAQEVKTEQIAQELAAQEAAEQAVREQYERWVDRERENLIAEAYRAGLSERKAGKIEETAQEFVKKLSESEATRKEQFVNMLQKRLPSYKVRLEYNDLESAGWVVREAGNGELVINGNMDYNSIVGATSAHELAHVAEDSGKYEELKKTVREYAGLTDDAVYREAVNERKQFYAEEGIAIDDTQAEHEVIAHQVEQMFAGRGEWVHQIVKKERSLAVKMFDWVKDKVEYLKTLRTEGQEVATAYRQMVKVRRLLHDALTEAGKRIESDTRETDAGLSREGKPKTVREAVSEPVSEDTGVSPDSEANTPEIADTDAVAVTADDVLQGEVLNVLSPLKPDTDSTETNRLNEYLADLEEQAYEKGFASANEYARSLNYVSAEALADSMSAWMDVAVGQGYTSLLEYATANGYDSVDALLEFTSKIPPEQIRQQNDFDYDDYNTPEENAELEEAMQEAEEYERAVEETEETTEEAYTDAELEGFDEEAAAQAFEDEYLLTSGMELEGEMTEAPESNTRDADGLMNPETFAEDWKDFAVNELGWTAERDKLNGYAQSIGFTGEQQLLEDSLLIPYEWYRERGMGKEGFTADDFRAATREYYATHEGAREKVNAKMDAFEAEQDSLREKNIRKEAQKEANKQKQKDAYIAEKKAEYAASKRAADRPLFTPEQSKAYTKYERALKKEIEATERARKANKLMKLSTAFREAGDWTAYRKAVEGRIQLGGGKEKLSIPGQTLKVLENEFGIRNIKAKALGDAENFALYDRKASQYIVNGEAASDVAFAMYAIGEKLKEMTGIGDPSDTYRLADFLTDWMMTNDKNLPKVATQFMGTFQDAMNVIGDSFSTAMQTAREKLQAFNNANVSDRLAAFMTTRSEIRTKQRLPDMWRKLKIGIDDTYAAELSDSLTDGHTLRSYAAYLPYNREVFDRNVFGDEFVGVDGKRLGGDTLKTVLKGITNDEFDLFNQYLMYKEALTRYDLGKNPFPVGEGYPTREQMETFLNETEAANPHFEEASKKLDRFWDRFMRTFMVGEHLLDAESYETMHREHPHYVPFTREGSGNTYRFASTKSSSKAIYQPIENMMALMRQFTNEAVQNRFMRVFDEMYQANNELGVIAVPAVVDAEVANMPHAILQKEIFGDGLKQDDLNPDGTLKSTGETPTLNAATEGGNVIDVARADGTHVSYRIMDKALYNLLAGKSQYVQNKALRAISKVTKTMTLLTTGVNPVFNVKNFVRDLQKSVNYGSWAYSYVDGFVKWAKAFAEVWSESERYKDYSAMGGGGWSRLEMLTTKGTKNYRNRLLGRDRKGFRNKLKNAYLKFGETIETTSRFVEYAYGKHDLTTADGRREAFMAGQEATVDFRRGGNLTRMLGNFVPFANATIQGNYQMYRMFSDAEKGNLQSRLTKTFINNTLMGIGSALLCARFCGEEWRERYDLLPDSYKQDYVLIPLPESAEREFLRLPVAQDGLARLFYEFGRQIGSGEITDVGGFGGDMFEIALGAMTEGVTDARPIWSVFVDVARNKNWANSTLVSQSLLSLPGYEREYTDTPAFFSGLSEVLHGIWTMVGADEDGMLSTLTTPIALQYEAEQLLGMVGSLILPFFSPDSRTGEWNIGIGAENIARSVRNSFTVDVDSYNVETDYYYRNCNMSDEILYATNKGKEYRWAIGLTEEEKTEGYEVLKEATQNGGVLYEIEKQIEKLNNELNAVYARTDLSAREQNVIVEDYKEQIRELMGEANDWYTDYRNAYVDRNWIEDILPPSKATPLTKSERAIRKLPEQYQDDLDEAYMAEGIRLATALNVDNVLPRMNYVPYRTIDGVQWEYDLNGEAYGEYKELYDSTYRDTYIQEADELLASTDYLDASDADKAEMYKNVHTKAHNAAKNAIFEQMENDDYDPKLTRKE